MKWHSVAPGSMSDLVPKSEDKRRSRSRSNERISGDEKLDLSKKKGKLKSTVDEEEEKKGKKKKKKKKEKEEKVEKRKVKEEQKQIDKKETPKDSKTSGKFSGTLERNPTSNPQLEKTTNKLISMFLSLGKI